MYKCRNIQRIIETDGIQCKQVPLSDRAEQLQNMFLTSMVKYCLESLGIKNQSETA